MYLFLLLASMGLQGWYSLRGTKREDVFESDSPEFIDALRPYLSELSTKLQTPRDWKRLLNQLRQAAISITPMLCDPDSADDPTVANYREAAEGLAQCQRERSRHGPGLRRAWLQAKEERARAKLPQRRYARRLEKQAMADVVAVILEQCGVGVRHDFSAERRELIQANLPESTQL